MEKNNSRKSMKKTLLVMAVSGMIGGACGFLLNFIELNRLKEAAEAVMTWYGRYGGWLMLPVIAAHVLTLSYHFKKEQEWYRRAEQEEEESSERADMEAQAERHMSALMTWCSCGSVLSLMLFGLAVVKPDIRGLLVWIAAILLETIAVSWFQIRGINRIKEEDPMKKGDAADFGFQKTWMKSLDEGEKMIVYRSSYQTMQVMNKFWMGALMAAIIGELFAGTGILAILIAGTGAFIQNFYYCRRASKAGALGNGIYS